MASEIERKFLVAGPVPWHLAESTAEIRQGYLVIDEVKQVRIRVIDSKGYLCVKSRREVGTLSREEYEYEIPLEDSVLLLRLCGDQLVHKRRSTIPWETLRIEIDVYGGRHEGLAVAEVELPREDHPFEPPDWLGPEVTFDERYSNCALAAGAV